MTTDIQAKLNYADAIAEWFLDLSDAHKLRGDLKNALKCNYIAATILCQQNRALSSPRIESNLQAIANGLLEPKDRSSRKPAGREVCLHVLREALPAGGIIGMVSRWMRNDRGRVHSVALLEQKIPVPRALEEAVQATGGSIHQANADESLLQRAAWLRELAHTTANYVILHIHNADVVSAVAFGTKGGPPVLLVNHSAHAFWVGASIADLVVNCRGSAFEGLWTSKLRGARHAIVPIPLVLPESRNGAAVSEMEVKRQAKTEIGLPPDAVVLLTVGASFKYEPVGAIDFLRAAENVLLRVPEVFLLAVGVSGNDRWRAASQRLGSRILTLGTVSQAQLNRIRAATDIYIEGFPFGTTTSLLEAGLNGIPTVLAPAQAPPPYASDGVALDDVLERPTTIAAYEEQIVALSKDANARRSLGKTLRAAIAKHHTGEGWNRYLEKTLQSLPVVHAPAKSITANRTPAEIHELWPQMLEVRGSHYSETLETALMRALKIGLKPRITRNLMQACANWKAIRAARTVPVPVLMFYCNVLLPLLPTRWAGKLFRLVVYSFQGSLFSRLRQKIARVFGGGKAPTKGYDEYRRIVESPQPATGSDDSVLIKERVEAARCHAL
jgi:hypothetical protein